MNLAQLLSYLSLLAKQILRTVHIPRRISAEMAINYDRCINLIGFISTRRQLNGLAAAVPLWFRTTDEDL